MLNILEFCSDGVRREALKAHIKTVHPSLKDNSINTLVNVIQSELDCLTSDGDQFVLTDRGRDFLESEDPGTLMDWLVTRILGVDHLLVILRDQGPSSRADTVRRIQKVNPGWTTEITARFIVRELLEFDMLDCDESNVLYSERCR